MTAEGWWAEKQAAYLRAMREAAAGKQHKPERPACSTCGRPQGAIRVNETQTHGAGAPIKFRMGWGS